MPNNGTNVTMTLRGVDIPNNIDHHHLCMCVGNIGNTAKSFIAILL